jgi:hypothetical protein
MICWIFVAVAMAMANVGAKGSNNSLSGPIKANMPNVVTVYQVVTRTVTYVSVSNSLVPYTGQKEFKWPSDSQQPSSIQSSISEQPMAPSVWPSMSKSLSAPTSSYLPIMTKNEPVTFSHLQTTTNTTTTRNTTTISPTSTSTSHSTTSTLTSDSSVVHGMITLILLWFF